MYIGTDSPDTRELSIRVDGERISASFKDGKARVTKEIGEILLDKLDNVYLVEDETKDSEDIIEES